MATSRIKKQGIKGEDPETTPEPKGLMKAGSGKITHITSEDFINALNNAVTNVTAIFQLRDQLQTEVAAFKDELEIGREMKLEQSKLETLKREQEEFQYDFQIGKTRLDHELNETEEAHKEKLDRQQEEQKSKLKSETEGHTLKLKLEKEEQERALKREKEDWEREKAQLALEKKAFEESRKALEADRTALRGVLIQELNKDNAHAIEILKLNHQKEVELFNGEIKLERANLSKFETMLKEARVQIEKLSNQLTELSKDALASASTSSVASKLKEIISQMPIGGSTTRVS